MWSGHEGNVLGPKVDPCKSRGPMRREDRRVTKETGRGYAASFEDGGKGHEPRDLGACGSWKRAKQTPRASEDFPAWDDSDFQNHASLHVV